MKTGDDPLIRTIAVDYRPDIPLRILADDLQIAAEGFQTMTTPNIVFRAGMSKWAEIFVENIFMKVFSLSHFEHLASKSIYKHFRPMPRKECRVWHKALGHFDLATIQGKKNLLHESLVAFT